MSIKLANNFEEFLTVFNNCEVNYLIAGGMPSFFMVIQEQPVI